MKNLIKAFILIVITALFIISCQDKEDESGNTTVDSVAIKKQDSINKLKLSINYFIWSNMSFYYLWTDKIDALNEQNYSSNSDLENKLLKNYIKSPEEFFYTLLYQKGVVDRFSWIVDDYEALEAMFQGITKSMGYDFILGRIGNTNNVFGLVRYVVKGGPAERAGLKRGDFFTRINDEQITISNYQSLLSIESSYKIGLARVSNHTIYDVSTSYNLTSEVVYENPIYLDTVYSINNTKIGYLVYNGFTSNYDNELNAVFAKFKQQGVQKLILDLRYNGGGALSTAVHLASMIYTTDKTVLFNKNSYNTALQEYIVKNDGADALNTYFTDKIDTAGGLREEPINSLGLNSLYVITTRSSASASEILINDLKPYINVSLIGDTTYGKYVGSITIKDYDTNGNLNTKHKWALQPIIMKSTNKNGVSDFYKGLAPDTYCEEDFTNLLPFGNTNETMLKATLAKITGLYIFVKKNNTPVFKAFADRKDLIPHSKEMHLNNIFKIKK